MVYGASISYEIGGGIPHEYLNIHTPLGIAYPLAMVRKYLPDVKIQIIDQAFQNLSSDALLDLILTEDFDVLGFSVYVWDAISVFNWIKAVKKENKDIKIVIGGPHFSYIYQKVMRNLPELDFIIRKEGEIPFLELIKRIRENNTNYKDIPNLVYRDEGNDGIIENKLAKPPIQLDAYASPYLTGILDEYLKDKCRYIGLQTSRGCPFSCRYCVWNIQSSYNGVSRIRYFSLDRVISELKYIEKRIKKWVSIEIFDATFNENKKRMLEMCQAIQNNRIKLRLGVRIRADLLDNDQIKMLKKMGVWIIRVGVESIGDSLKAVRRSQSLDKITKNLDSIKKSGIHISGNIMVGLPQQTRNEVLNTIEYAKNQNIDSFTVNVYEPATGTEIYNFPEKFGMNMVYENIDGRRFFESKSLKRNEIIDLATTGNVILNKNLLDILKKYKSMITFI